MTGTVKAECVPLPDCASIGYTATSCDGDSIKCPFDISKLLCIPCDTKYKYTCTGDNISGGVGCACNGKYASCECLGCGAFTNVECLQNCTVGMIYYSDKSCTNDLDSSKIAIGIVVKDNTLIMSEGGTKYGRVSGDVNGLSYYSYVADAKKDMDGKKNTEKLVASMGGEFCDIKICTNLLL